MFNMNVAGDWARLVAVFSVCVRTRSWTSWEIRLIRVSGRASLNKKYNCSGNIVSSPSYISSLQLPFDLLAFARFCCGVRFRDFPNSTSRCVLFINQELIDFLLRWLLLFLHLYFFCWGKISFNYTVDWPLSLWTMAPRPSVHLQKGGEPSWGWHVWFWFSFLFFPTAVSWNRSSSRSCRRPSTTKTTSIAKTLPRNRTKFPLPH